MKVFPDDDEIFQLVQSGADKDKGYRLLIGKYKEKLYWHIRRMIEDHDDADDVLQNTFLKVVKYLGQFQQQSSLYTWMYKIATNECLNFIQNAKNRRHESMDNSAVYYLKSQESTDGDLALNKLEEAIHLLPEKQKLVFNLRYYDEMSYQQISDITDTSVGALKASYHLAVKKIEEHIKSSL